MASLSSCVVPMLFLALFAHAAAAANYTFTADFLSSNSPGVLSWNNTQPLVAEWKAPLPSPSGWISWGFAEKTTPDGIPRMPGASAFIAYLKNGAATVTEFYISGKSASSVQPANLLKPSKLTATYDGTIITISFTLTLNSTLKSTPIALWAHGNTFDLTATPITPKKHDFGMHGGAALDWTKSTGGGGVNSNNSKYASLVTAHVVFAAVGWAILVPLGVFIARYLRPLADPLWYELHRGVQGTAILLGFIAFALGAAIRGYNYSAKDRKHDVHFGVGVALIVLFFLQAVGIFFRPHLNTPMRPTWNVVHHVVGYVALAAIIYNESQGWELYYILRTGDSLYYKWLVFGFLIGLAVLAFFAEAFYIIKYGEKWYSLKGQAWMPKTEDSEPTTVSVTV